MTFRGVEFSSNLLMFSLKSFDHGGCIFVFLLSVFDQV